MRQDFVQTVNCLTSAVDTPALAALIETHRTAGARMLDAAGVAFSGRSVVVELDMAYLGQTHTVPVPLEGAPTPQAIGAAFDAAYLRAYGRLLPGGVTRILNLRTAVIGHRPKLDLATLAPVGPGTTAARTTRPVHFGAWHQAAIHDRLDLPVGARIKGPAVLEQPDTTILVEPGLVAEVDAYGNIRLTREVGK
jgi:N-methylhydantoinase A